MDKDIRLWAEKLNLEPLFDHIRDILELPDLKFTYEVRDSGRGVNLMFESQDLSNRVGFLKALFANIKVASFNSDVRYSKEDDEEEATPKLWGTASFRYTHPMGGSNGHSFLTYWYQDDRGWYFRQDF